MPDPVMGIQSDFIWYKAEGIKVSDLLAWLDQVSSRLNIKGTLYVRDKDGETTYMEVYNDLRAEDSVLIANLASKYPLFQSVDRRHECFKRLG